MREHKVVNLRRGDVIVKQVTPRQLLKVLPFFSVGQQDEDKNTDFMAEAKILLQDCCGLTPDDLLDLYDSELEQLWQAFMALNPFFFRVARQFGLADKAEKALSILLEACGGTFASLFREDILTRLTTASHGLEPPSPPPEGNGAAA